MSNLLLDRQVRRRLAVFRHAERVTGNVAVTRRYYGISRRSYYTWYPRHQADRPDGLRDRLHRPHTSPNAISTEVVSKILYLR